MEIAFIGSYPPRECGIGTFTQDHFASMSSHKDDTKQLHEAMVIAMDDQEDSYDYRKKCSSAYNRNSRVIVLKQPGLSTSAVPMFACWNMSLAFSADEYH